MYSDCNVIMTVWGRRRKRRKAGGVQQESDISGND